MTENKRLSCIVVITSPLWSMVSPSSLVVTYCAIVPLDANAAIARTAARTVPDSDHNDEREWLGMAISQVVEKDDERCSGKAGSRGRRESAEGGTIILYLC